MSQLLDALRKTRDQAANTGTSAPLELAPLAPPADVASHPTTPQQRIAPPQSPVHQFPRNPLPRPSALLLAALAGGLVAGIWVFLMSAPLVPQPALAVPPTPTSVAGAPQAPEPSLPPTPSPDTTNPAPTTEAPHRDARPPHATQRNSTQTTPDTVPRFLRNSAPNNASARALDDAFKAYSAGDLARAEILYRQALATNPHNADALLGLGATALTDGRLREAEAYFRQALASRPQDPVALAGLSRAQPAAAQTSRLREILQDQPDAPPRLVAQLALAERLARDGRWAEAQQAYFDAHRLAPTDADVTYNLAVSLDHLGQRRAASGFYQQALQLAEHAGHARFSREQCAARLATLSATP